MAGPVAAADAVTDPPANRDLSRATLSACQSSPGGAACQNAALTDLNAARAAEGIGPHYRFTIRPHGRGTTRYRVMLPATSTHARGLSAGRVLHVA
jgi:hypothetical protein